MHLPLAFSTTMALLGLASAHIAADLKTLRSKPRGVNLGGWLVVEQWMTWDSPVWTNVTDPNAQDEYTLYQSLGQVQGDKQFKLHRDTWITELDLKLIHEAGLNMVRVPVGYWIQGCVGLPASLASQCAGYAPGGLPYLDSLIQKWAKTYNVAVLISVHGAPGSQNGADHSGTIDGKSSWSDSYDNVLATRNFVSFLANRYKNDDAFLGIGLLNEPGGSTNDATMEQYFQDVYYDVRSVVGSDCILMTSPLLWFQSNGWGPHMEWFGQYMTNVWHDWHPYLVWGYESVSESDIISKGAFSWGNNAWWWQGHPLHFGEWSFSGPGGKFNTADSATKFRTALLDMVGNAQAGWSLWSWRIAGDNAWNGWNVRGLFNAYNHSNQFDYNNLPNATQPLTVVRANPKQRLELYQWLNGGLVRNDKFISLFGVVDMERWVYYPTSHQVRSDRSGLCLDGFFQDGVYGAHEWWCDYTNVNQKWTFTNHTIRHDTYAKCLAMYSNGTNTLAPCNAADPTQYFAVNEVSRLVSAKDGAKLISYGASSTSGVTKVTTADPATQWYIQHDTHQVTNTVSGECLDGYQAQQGGAVHTWACNPANLNQLWAYDATTRQLRHWTHVGFCLDLSSAPVLNACLSPSDPLFKAQQIHLQWISNPAIAAADASTGATITST
ncbi:Aste57867_25049 [Aphanomyces stellatus]|uniref:glucan 1,3-beta-glucosidase n=1 Tax=Aphanomyces stellatus TaxID=120398 RepID=A0A485LST1_9STRA|nr:hypothetical protein As57867_024971 [Aphanomyces stellatus]VFU01680.1 Aste57867_25049 [Aphanomyces stellatus]